MSQPTKVQLEASWYQALKQEFDKPYFLALREFLKQQKAKGISIYPPGPQMFRAFELCPLPQTQVVILGQDPYHGPGQAHGLSFSVPRGVDVPPSLKNIYAELQRDLNLPLPEHGCLEKWARQGVLLLNATLSVQAHVPNSHQNKGWEPFTDSVISVLNEQREHLVFLLWGKYAQAKARLIDPRRHFVLKAPHPSPLSAHRGFLGCGHFSATNRLLTEQGLEAIDWSVN